MIDRMRRLCGLVLSVASLLAVPAWAQDTGFTLRETDVRAKPFLDAELLTKLPEKTPVTVLTRQGGWMQVRTGETQGWVRMLSLRLGNPDPKKNDTTFLAAITRSSRPSASPTVTTGVRGFSEEDLKAAKPSPEEVARMETFAVPPAGAAQFAAFGKLVAKPVPYVKADGKPEKESK